MSDYKPLLNVNFISRRSSAPIVGVPRINRLNINSDLRQLTDSFDFDIQYRMSEKIDLQSHDFIEAYLMVDGTRVQVFAGFLEDFVGETSPSSHRFQANGRDFLGQQFNLPFLQANPADQMSLVNFANYCVKDSYLADYARYCNRTTLVSNNGAFNGTLAIPHLSDAKRAQVLQSIADEVFNVVYQDSLGRAVVWGRDQLDANDTGLTLRETGDLNVKSMSVRQNFSRVFSQAKVLYTGGAGNVDFNLTPSANVFNSEPLAANIFQPEVRSFQMSTLVTTAPSAVSIQNKLNQLAGSIVRKSNQNLASIVVKAAWPFYVDSLGRKTVYQKNQLWNVSCPSYGISRKMRLVGVGYVQDAQSLETQLLLIPKDSLI